MRSLCALRRSLALGACCMQILWAAPASAAGFWLTNTQLLLLMQSVASQNECVSYTFDKNGNVLTKVSQAHGSAAVWGSSVFGCFSWTAS